MLLTIGVFSLLERILLASVQYRQGPVTSMLHGFSQLVADGVKIYSKYSLDALSWSVGLMVLGVGFSSFVGISMLVFSSSLLTAVVSDSDLLVFVCVVGLFGSLCLVPMVVATNRYANLGCVRQVRALILADIGIESSLLVLLVAFVTLDSGGEHTLSHALGVVSLVVLFTPLFLFVLIGSARAPFDLPEAESELVAGSLTELGGSAFSFVLLVDYFEVLVWCTLVSILVVVGFVSSVLVLMFVLISYTGRLILCRVLLTDLPRLLFLVLL